MRINFHLGSDNHIILFGESRGKSVVTHVEDIKYLKEEMNYVNNELINLRKIK